MKRREIRATLRGLWVTMLKTMTIAIRWPSLWVKTVGGRREKKTGTKPELKNVYLASPDEESVLQISWGRDDNVFEGDDNDLGQGKDRATLTDGAKDTDAYAGGNGSLVDGIDEIGKKTETTLTDGAKGANSRSVKDMDEIVDKSTGGNKLQQGCQGRSGEQHR